ncbi:MAG: DUF4331 family protein [Myxococcota bacterium]
MTKTTLFLSLFALAACTGDDPDPMETGNPQETGMPQEETGTPEDPFVFATDPATAYARVDRMGMPAINTAVITSKDLYNAADPTDDANGDFVAEITTNVTALHDALDDDLTGASLTPCAPMDCVTQAAPLVVPDHLTIDPSGAAAFPNGRGLPDPVMDVTLAVVLLDLGTHPVDVLATLPLNPPANDLPFGSGFPYLANAH